MKINWSALVAKIAGGALTGVAPLLGSFFPKQQALWTAIFGTTGLLVLIAGLFAQSQMPATKIVTDASIVNDAGEQVATNVSSTSQLLQKGT